MKTFWHKVNSNVEDIQINIGRKKSDPQDSEPSKAQIIRLPVWAEAVRGTPNSALRGALFSAIIPNKRKALYKEMISDEKNLKIKFTGWQLDQGDRDVWEQALHMARQQPLGTDIYFSARGFLKSLGKTSIGKTQVEWLDGSLSRLLGCGVEITHEGYTYGGSLLEFERDEDTRHYKLSINPKMMKLYDSGWTQNDFEERKKIGNKKYLALWLHGYISSHAKIYPMKIETFHKLSGSSNICMRSFKRQLLIALEYLKTLNLIKNFDIKNNLIHIEKYPSESQKRYLEK